MRPFRRARALAEAAAAASRLPTLSPHKIGKRVADIGRGPLVCVMIGMLACGVISRCPRCRLSTRDTLALRNPVGKVWSVFDAVLHRWRKIVGLVETAYRDGDAIDRNAPVRERCAALTAEVARDRCRRVEGAGLPSGPHEVGARNTGEGLEVVARCFLAHAAPANACMRRLGHEGVAKRATLASAAPYAFGRIRHEGSPRGLKLENNVAGT